MAYLDSSNVEDLVADIKELADETYAPIDSIMTFLNATTTWEQGSISGTGADTDSTTRIRTKNYIPADDATVVRGIIDSGYMFSIVWYNSSKTFVSGTEWKRNSADVNKPSNATYCRIIFAFANSAAITIAAATHIIVSLKMTVKKAIDTIDNRAKYDIYEAGIYYFNKVICAAYITGSGNYIDFFLPIKVNPSLSISVTYEKSYHHEGDTSVSETSAYTPTDGRIGAPANMADGFAAGYPKISDIGLTFELGFLTTKTPTMPATILLTRLIITAT